MAGKENIDPLIHIWKSKAIYLPVVLARVQCYMIFFPLNEEQKSHFKTKSGWIYKGYLKVWHLCSIMSKQNGKSTEGQYLEQLEGYRDLFWLSGWVSALSYAVSVIVPLYVWGN